MDREAKLGWAVFLLTVAFGLLTAAIWTAPGATFAGRSLLEGLLVAAIGATLLIAAKGARR